MSIFCPPMEPSYSTSSQGSMQSAFSYVDSYPMPTDPLDIPRTQPAFDSYFETMTLSPYTQSLPDQLLYDDRLGFVPNPQVPTPSLLKEHWDPLFDVKTPINLNCRLPFVPAYPPKPVLSPVAAIPDPPPAPQSAQRPDKPNACPSCGNTFTRSADLKRHYTSVHYPTYRDCPIENCSRKGSNGFPRQDHLNEHLRSCHHVPLPKRGRVSKNCVSKRAI